MLVLPLSGGCDVTCDDERVTLTGRKSVFSRVTDFAYVPRDVSVTVRAPNGGRFALPAARATRTLPFRYGAAEDVQVELRGAGQASRQVNNFCTPGSFECDRLIACKVLPPGGNWSSSPPHKHDEAGEGESSLEEIYYFEVAPSPSGGPGAAYQRGYGHEDRPIDVCTEVRSGDVVLIPYGWHGPSMAAPGFRQLESLSSVLYVSSTFGIPAVAVALLMIGGEFDLSAGVAVTSSALVASMFSYQFTANMWVGVIVSLVVALVIGFINGYLVVKTGIPSFLVTLGTFFMLRGLNLALTKVITGNVATNDVSDIQGFA